MGEGINGGHPRQKETENSFDASVPYTDSSSGRVFISGKTPLYESDNTRVEIVHLLHSPALYVLKMRSAGVCPEEYAANALLREKEIIQSLEYHPNIVLAFDCITSKHQGEYALIEQFVGGPGILELIPVLSSPDDSFDFAYLRFVHITSSQLQSALSWIHAHNIVHGDVNERNIRFRDDEKETLVMYDFSHAQQLNGESQVAGTCAGDSELAPPERNWGVFSQAGDIYMMGALHLGLVMQQENPGKIFDTITCIQNGDPIPFAGPVVRLIPHKQQDALSILLSQTVAYNPAQRPSIQEFRTQWNALVFPALQ